MAHREKFISGILGQMLHTERIAHSQLELSQ